MVVVIWLMFTGGDAAHVVVLCEAKDRICISSSGVTILTNVLLAIEGAGVRVSVRQQLGRGRDV